MNHKFEVKVNISDPSYKSGDRNSDKEVVINVSISNDCEDSRRKEPLRFKSHSQFRPKKDSEKLLDDAPDVAAV